MPTFGTRGGFMDVQICQICKEPIHNFVCIDCLANDISKWLSSNISASFNNFNERFLNIFNYHQHNRLEQHHLICSARGNGNVCLHCYVNEVFQWLKCQDKSVARRFRKIFSFGMK